MINLQISDSLAGQPPVETTLLERAAQETLQAGAAPTPADLTIVLSDDAHLQALNRQYLGVDAATDVLSFPSDAVDPDTGAAYLGDILISQPRATAQAAAAGHALGDELQLLVVHGVLHLLGHDHAEPAEKSRMWALQAQVLERLGCSILFPSE